MTLREIVLPMVIFTVVCTVIMAAPKTISETVSGIVLRRISPRISNTAWGTR